MIRCVWAVLLVAGCGFDEERFLVKGVDRWCEQSASCAGTFEKQVCVDRFRVDWEGCAYDPAAGKACYVELEEAQCQHDDLLDLSVLVPPEICDTVFTCSEGE